MQTGEFRVKVLADSISREGVRLTTVEATFPRFILAELNTHRMFSRNSASSRAIPTEKIIEAIRRKPFVPLTFNKRVKGMGVGDALDDDRQLSSRMRWLTARDAAVTAAEVLVKLDVDKSRANRLLEPFMWHTAIISATEWENFFGLRCHPAAQPEMRMIAEMIRAEMDASEPIELLDGGGRFGWHLPLVRDKVDGDLLYRMGTTSEQEITKFLKLISASRCARVSYDKHNDDEDITKTINRAETMMQSVPAHLSPFEHVARPATYDDVEVAELYSDEKQAPHEAFFGNFQGWVQMRREIPYEDNALKMIEAANA